MTTIIPDRQGLILLGRRTENAVLEVSIPCRDLGDGSGAYVILFQRPGKEELYPVTVRNEYPNIIWEVTDTDTAISGTGRAEVRWYGPENETGISKTYTVRIEPSLTMPEEPGDGWEQKVKEVLQSAQEAKEAASGAEASAGSAAASAESAEAAADRAEGAAQQAETAAEEAGGARDAAVSAQEAAGASAGSSLEAEEAAEAAAQAAALSETGAKDAQAAAEAAQKKAEAAQGTAESARTEAVSASQGAAASAASASQEAEKAKTAREGAEAAQSGAQAAQRGTEVAKEAAEGAKTAAEKASADATAALSKAQAAATSAAQNAAAAETAKSGAEAARDAAAGSAAAAAESATAAAGSATQAEEAKAAAEGSVEAAVEPVRVELAETKAALESTQKELGKAQRAIKLQAKLTQGQNWDFEESTEDAYTRQVPSGAYAGAVTEFGGHTVAWNQVARPTIIIAAAGTTISDTMASAFNAGHKYYVRVSSDPVDPDKGNTEFQVYGHLAGAWRYHLTVSGRHAAIYTMEVEDTLKIVRYAENTLGILTITSLAVDLTRMFGPGNEPTDTSDPRIAQIEAYAAEHPEYNGGELVSAEVDKANVMGKNLLNLDTNAYKYSITGTGLLMGNTCKNIVVTSNRISCVTDVGWFGIAVPITLEKGETYYYDFEDESSGRTYISFTKLTSGTDNIINKGSPFTAPESGLWYIHFCVSDDNGTLDIRNPAVYVGQIRDYAPYRLDTYPIPEAVKALPGYGWSAGDVRNTIERTEDGWQFVQRVGKTTIALTAEVGNQQSDFDNDTSFMIGIRVFPKIGTYAGTYRALRCNNFTPVAKSLQNPRDTDEYVIASHPETKYSYMAYFRFPYTIQSGLSNDSTSAEKEAAAKAWFDAHETTIYYEQEPVTTDITDLMADALDPFETEPGWSITLHNEAALDVPGTVKYVTKLSEVNVDG